MIKSSKLHISEKFGIAPNELLNNPNISLRAKGLFTYIQSKPNGWDFSVMRITLQMKDGRKAIMTAVRELEELGYLLRKPARNNEGQWTGYIYTLSQTPLAEKGSAVKGSAVKGITLSKKDIVKKNIVKKNIESSKVKILREININPLIDLWKNNIGYEDIFKNKTERKVISEWVDKFGYEKTENMIKWGIANQNQYYTATKPTELKRNINKIILKEKNTNKQLIKNYD